MGDDKQKEIIEFLQRQGPSLPVHIAKKIKLDLLFTGAFLSELVKEKQIKMSHMKIGSSQLYMLPGQEESLENLIEKLKGREKEACLLLKKQGVLEDSEQTPVMRVALRSIKDFAIPFKI